jgi:hypothetical protein
MTETITLTSTDTAAHNLYQLILAELEVTQLPQRVDLGAVFFPDFVASVTFSLSLQQTGNSGQSLSVQDQGGFEYNDVLPGIPWMLGPGNINAISLQGLKIQASAVGVVTDVSIVQI